MGRYLAVVPGGSLTRLRHPVEALPTSLATFSIGRENFAPYFGWYQSGFGLLNTTRAPTPQPQEGPSSIGSDVWVGADVTLSWGNF